MPKGIFPRKPGLKRNRKSRPIEDRYREKVVIRDDGCWWWTGFVDKAGYGRLQTGRRSEPVAYAHRVSYELHNGPIAEGMELDHLCRNRWCSNWEHLEAVPHVVNLRRGQSPTAVLSQAGVCARGHEFNETNTYVVVKTGGRQCRICKRFRRNREGISGAGG